MRIHAPVRGLVFAVLLVSATAACGPSPRATPTAKQAGPEPAAPPAPAPPQTVIVAAPEPAPTASAPPPGAAGSGRCVTPRPPPLRRPGDLVAGAPPRPPPRRRPRPAPLRPGPRAPGDA